MKNNSLRFYIVNIRKITITKAAHELGCSRVHLSDVIGGRNSCGKNLAKTIEVWTEGRIKAAQLLGV